MLMSLMITSRFFDFERRENGFYVGNFTIILPLPNSRHKKTNRKWLVSLSNIGRHERIRTSDPRHPMTVRYQAALHADAEPYTTVFRCKFKQLPHRLL